MRKIIESILTSRSANTVAAIGGFALLWGAFGGLDHGGSLALCAGAAALGLALFAVACRRSGLTGPRPASRRPRTEAPAEKPLLLVERSGGIC